LSAFAEIEAQNMQGDSAAVRHGFFFKHLNGEYSLPRAFWLNTIVIAWILPMLALVAQSLNLEKVSERIASIEFLAIVVLEYVLLVWGAIGTSRSGKRYVKQGGSSLWRIAAVGMTIFLIADTALYLSRAALLENVHMAFTGHYGPPASIRDISNGAALLVKGDLQEGTAEALMKVAAASSTATLVVLDSKGGLFEQARLMSQVISKHRLNTYVERECSSACALVFLAGASRCISSTARIGFHAGRRLGGPPELIPRAIADAQRDLYIKAALPTSFVEKIMTTPNRSIWYPSYPELVDANVVTQDCPHVNSLKVT
jgi:hypothetical protein